MTCQSLAKDQRWGCRYPVSSAVVVGKAATASGEAAGVGIGGGGGQSQGVLCGGLGKHRTALTTGNEFMTRW